jgi:tetratricopeptide (TPR) repeat protein
MKLSIPKAKALKEIGNTLMQKNNPEEAIIAYREAISVDPSYIPAYANLGLALGMTGNIKEAQKVYEEALQYGANDYRLLLNLGILYVRTEQSTKAIDVISKLLACVPDIERPRTGAMANLYITVAYVKQKAFIKAYQSLTTALELNPQVEPGGFDLLQNAVAAELLSTQNDSLLLSISGIINLINEESDSAIEAFQKAVAIDGDAAEAYFGLGMALGYPREEDSPFDDITSNRLNRAVEAFAKVTELKPAWIEAHYRIGLLSLKLLDIEAPHRAYYAFQQVIELAKEQNVNNKIVEETKQLLKTNEVLQTIARK